MIAIWALISYIFMWYFNLPWGAFFALWTAFTITNFYSAYKAASDACQEALKLVNLFKSGGRAA